MLSFSNCTNRITKILALILFFSARVHRIGQKREVTVVKYVCQETVEERLLEVQDQKQVLSAAALRKVSPDEMRRVRATQLRRLFDSVGPPEEVRG